MPGSFSCLAPGPAQYANVCAGEAPPPSGASEPSCFLQQPQEHDEIHGVNRQPCVAFLCIHKTQTAGGGAGSPMGTSRSLLGGGQTLGAGQALGRGLPFETGALAPVDGVWLQEARPPTPNTPDTAPATCTSTLGSQTVPRAPQATAFRTLRGLREGLGRTCRNSSQAREKSQR